MRFPRAVRGLKLPEWPLADQTAWFEACCPGGRLTRGGRASHLKQVTRDDLARRYGQYLDHVVRTDRLDDNGFAAASVTQDRVASYVAELTARVSSVTVHGSIAKLRRATELLNPSMDLDWLRDIENDLALEMRPASKFHRIVDSDLIIYAGLTLMEEAGAVSEKTALNRAILYRNGLMMALLALCPIRLKNLSSLVLDRNIRRIGDNWYIALEAQETKETRPDERPVDPLLTPYIRSYLETHRPVFNCPSKALWAGRYGKSLGYSAVERIITETTRQTLGVAISPHLFRSCGASTSYMLCRDMPDLASALLNHRSRKTTQAHYNRARCAFYAREFIKLVED